MRWVGIDEAGYGPNLGPLVMTAVVAEGPGEDAPDPWRDLAATVDRAGGDPKRLWVDDSKRIYQAGRGLDRLEAAFLATLAAAGRGRPVCLSGLLAASEAGSLADAELAPWLADAEDPPLRGPGDCAVIDDLLDMRPLEGAAWRIVGVRAVVVGPARFNEAMGADGSKARAHYSAFARLLAGLWDLGGDGVETRVVADKHGGRHFYLDRLYDAVPDAWIDRGPEGPELSRYTLRDSRRRLDLRLRPRADAADGLVALASIASKAIRERWMACFNAYWAARVPGLRPTAGYPGDSTRFREAIEPHCRAMGLLPESWWRIK